MHYRSARGAMSFDLVIYMVLVAILLGGAFVGYQKLTDRSKQTVINNNLRAVQDALGSWVASQRTIADAAAHFHGSGSALIPRSYPQLAASLNEYFTDDQKLEPFSAGFATPAIRNSGAYLTVTWAQPFRSNNPVVTLISAEE